MKKTYSSARFPVIVWLLALLSALLPPLDAQAVFDTVIENGPRANRVNAFFLGDGYTSANLAAGLYANHIDDYVEYMFADSIDSDPFFRYRNFFNIYRVNVVSAESGADQPHNGIFRNTALDASYLFDGVTERLLSVDTGKANDALNAAVAGSGVTVDMRFVAVNDSVYGGAGGTYAVFAARDSSAREIAMHEMAHSFSGLADEYGGPGTYAGGEPMQPNITINPTGAKWSQWLGYDDPTGGVVGAYEGARQFDAGIYRPTPNSKMRNLGVPFNAVSREEIILDIYRNVDPLDSFSPTRVQYIDPTLLAVERIDDSVINTQWFVDNIPQPALDNASSINPLSLGLGLGRHTIKLRAYDPTGFDLTNGWVRINTTLLEQTVTWGIDITVPEPASLLLASAAFGFSVLVGSRQKTRWRKLPKYDS